MANVINKDINLLLPYNKKPKKQEKKKTNIGKIFILVILTASLLGVYALYMVKINSVNKDIDDANDYMNNPQNVESYNKSNDSYTKLTVINALNNQLTSEYALKQNSAQLNKDIFTKVYSVQSADVVINSIMYVKKDNSILLDISAKNELQVNETIKKLQDSGAFKLVSYSGYQLTSEKGGFSFRANCILNSPENKTKENNTNE